MRMSGGHSKASRAAGPATLSIQEPSAEAPGSSPHHQHPTRNSLPYGCADSVRLRITGTARETLTEPEQVRPGEESGIIILIRDCTWQAAPPRCPKGEDAPCRPHPPRCRAGRLRTAPQLPGPRDSVRLRRPQTLRPKQHLS